MAEATNDYPTVLGPDAVFKGELSFEKGLRLQGKFEGKINSGGRLHVAREARMQADVESGAIVVEGEVKGNLTANERIELKQTARYEGDLRATKLTVDEGAIFSGHVSVGPEAVKNRNGNGPGGAGGVSVSTNPALRGVGLNQPMDKVLDKPLDKPQGQPVK